MCTEFFLQIHFDNHVFHFFFVTLLGSAFVCSIRLHFEMKLFEIKDNTDSPADMCNILVQSHQ